MKLVRFGAVGSEKPGVIDDEGNIRDVSSLINDFTPSFFETNEVLKLRELVLSSLPTVDLNTRIGSPIGNPGKIVGIGLNYREHARESNAEIPKEPIVFLKATTSLSGPNDNIILPLGSVKTDWEVELGVVIGKKAKNISLEEALDYVFGYCVVNDVSERQHQLEQGGQWTKGKSHDTFCPIGPWIVSKDEIADVQDLKLWCSINGLMHQNSNTNDMIFTVAHCISYVSRYMTLLPGDVITTGTPEGVGLGFKPPKYLSHGDRVEMGIRGLGVQMQEVQSLG